MGRGSSKISGGAGGGDNNFAKQAAQNVKGITGYNVTRSDGVNLDFFFQTQDGVTYYSNRLGEIPQPTPNGWTEADMIFNIKRFGGSVTSYTNKQLVNMETQRLQDRQQTNDFLNATYTRNRGADQTNRAYRNTRRANRIARRNS